MTIISEMIQLKAVLAPMAGVTDIPFRIIARRFGCGFAFTEMVDANGLTRRTRKSFEIIKRVDEDNPLAVQIVGEDGAILLEAAKICQDAGFPLIDINAACPARKVVRCGKGVSLMKDPVKFAKIARTLVKGLNVPVTVKIRSGWDEDSMNYLEIGKIAESEGISAICIHTRTKAQMYKGKSDMSIVTTIKNELKIPVFASGNIFSARTALNVLKETGADGVFVARGSLGKPWIFRQILDLASNKSNVFNPTPEELAKVIIDHFGLLVRFYGIARAKGRMYKHLSWYLKGVKGLDAVMRTYRENAHSVEEFEKFIETVSLRA